jgi:hypothetical protein
VYLLWPVFFKKINMKKIIPAALIFISCHTTRTIPRSGLTTEKVTSVQRISVVTIHGVKGKFYVPSDTIKVNDEIPMSWVNKVSR